MRQATTLNTAPIRQAVFFQPGSPSHLFLLPLLLYGIILLRQVWMNRARRPKVVPT